MALSYRDYENYDDRQSQLRQRQIIENHGKVNLHFHLNEIDQLSNVQLPNVKFINYGEMNVFVEKCKICEKAIDNNPTTTCCCSNSSNSTPKINSIPSNTLSTILKFISFIIILFLLFVLLVIIFILL